MSSKTLKNSVEKTELAPKSTGWLKLVVISGAVILLISGILLFVNRTKFTINGHRVGVVRASTPEARAKGLGGWDGLKPNQGMLFVYDSPGIYCFWMKDMKFPIDMIWLDSNKQVVHIENDVAPETYPQTFCPDTDAQYVLEINVGKAKEWSIKPGVTGQF